MHLTEGYYEIIGSVKEDKSVKALTSIELGPNLGKFERQAVSSKAVSECPAHNDLYCHARAG